MSEHGDVEALSAYVDGEAPEWGDHVAGCAQCAATVEALRAVSDAVGAPVEPADPALRELALGAALTPPEPAPATVVPLRRRPSLPARWVVPAVAAMVLVVAGISAVLTVADRSSTRVNATAAGPAADSAKSNESLAQAPAPGSLGLAAPTTDLGDVADAATLLARARPGLAAAPRAATSSGAASAATAAPASPGATIPAPAVAGTRPCEEQARARQPSLGPVVYFATARRNGAPAVVLGFSTGPDPSQVTLLMLAQDGCAELLRAAGP